mgnify:CR=1 FL=1
MPLVYMMLGRIYTKPFDNNKRIQQDLADAWPLNRNVIIQVIIWPWMIIWTVTNMWIEYILAEDQNEFCYCVVFALSTGRHHGQINQVLQSNSVFRNTAF